MVLEIKILQSLSLVSRIEVACFKLHVHVSFLTGDEVPEQNKLSVTPPSYKIHRGDTLQISVK